MQWSETISSFIEFTTLEKFKVNITDCNSHDNSIYWPNWTWWYIIYGIYSILKSNTDFKNWCDSYHLLNLLLSSKHFWKGTFGVPFPNWFKKDSFWWSQAFIFTMLVCIENWNILEKKNIYFIAPKLFQISFIVVFR